MGAVLAGPCNVDGRVGSCMHSSRHRHQQIVLPASCGARSYVVCWAFIAACNTLVQLSVTLHVGWAHVHACADAISLPAGMNVCYKETRWHATIGITGCQCYIIFLCMCYIDKDAQEGSRATESMLRSCLVDAIV